MGYSMTQREISFFMGCHDKQAALSAFRLEMLAKVKTLGDGGGWQNGEKVKYWFSWTSNSVLEQAQAIEEVLEEFRWKPILDVAGNIVSLEFTGEKIGQEELLFEIIARFVRNGSYINMTGEDGYMWQWCFDGKHVKEHAIFAG